MTDALDRYGITPHSRAKVPDHSLLTCTMDIYGYSVIGRRMSSTATTANRGRHVEANESVHRRYRVNPLPSDIFINQRCAQTLISIIDSLQAAHMEQNALDSLYESFLKSVHTEMDNELEYKDYTPHTSKRKRSYKPYWNEHLKSQWTAVRDSERAYLACRGDNRNRRRLHEIFKAQRDGFDKNWGVLRGSIIRNNVITYMNLEHIIPVNSGRNWIILVQGLSDQKVSLVCCWRTAVSAMTQLWYCKNGNATSRDFIL